MDGQREVSAAPASPHAGGDMGARIRAFDWSATSLGPIEAWPQSLKLALGICLNSRFPMFVWWGPDHINLYNDAYIPMLGKRHPSALGRPARASWDDIWSVVGPQAEAVMQRGEATWNERVLLVMERHGFSEETWFTWSYSPIYDESGRVGGMYCAVVEETDRVRADEALRDAEQRYRAVFEASRDAMFIYTPDGLVVEANPAACRMYGFTRDQVVGVHAPDVIHPDAVPHFRAFQRMALAGGEFRCETVDRRADGTVFPIEVSGTALTYKGRPHLMSVIRDITDRRLVEAALRAGEEQMRLLTDALPALVGYVGSDLRYRFANRQYLDWFGFSPDQMIGRHLRDVLGEDVFSQRLPYAQAALRGEASHFEGVTRHRERGPVACDVTYVPDARPDRGVTGFVVLVQDISERKRNEEVRRMTEFRFQRLVELSPLSTQIFWPDGRTRQVNRAWELLWGVTLDDLRDYNILQDPQLAASGALTILQRAFSGESAGAIEPFPYVVPFGPAAGQIRWAGAHVYPVKDDAGRVDEVVLVHFDVTDQKRAEAATARDAMLLAHVRDSVIMTDLDGVITFWNEGATRLFGWTADETVGRPYAERLPEPSRSEVNAWIAQIAAGGGEFLGEWLDWRKDGSRVWIEASTRRVNDASGKPVGIMGVAHDITDRKAADAERNRLLAAEQAARAEAERQGRMKDEFLATLGHELRTPLNAILGWAQILKGGGAAADPDDLAEGLGTIERNARAQTQIIEDLLDMSRIISGKVHLDVIRLADAAPVLDAAVATVRPAAAAKGVHLDVTADSPAGPVVGDPNRLQQVFWNLLSNAVKFTPRGGTVRARAARIGSHVEVSVSDTGEGIAPDFLPHVFERFRQADASTTRRHGGLGLGLSIVRQLVELHGGSVAAHSDGPGRGATITVLLPLTGDGPDPRSPAESRPVARAPAAEAPYVSVEGLKVLLVDDEADTRSVIQWLLEERGASVTAAASVDEALRHFAADRPDVLVSDIGMPGEDGYSLIRRIRSLHPAQGGAVPAVALTAYARADDRTRALSAGYQHHVAKPVEPAELVAIVASLVKPRA